MSENRCSQPIPGNAITEILSWLPVKTLLRFKSVSKSWDTLIKSSTFIDRHLYHTKPQLFVRHGLDDIDKYVFALFPDETLASTTHHNLEESWMPQHPSIAGPFNGILCVWNWESMALWNPATREFKPLLMPCHLPPHFSAYCYFFGLGLVPRTNEYKLVWIRYFWDSKDDIPYLPSVIAVYTLSTDSWKVYDVDLPSNRSMHNSICNTYVKGFYYWRTNNDEHEYKVLSFDMDKEVFRDFPAPPGILKAQWGDLSVYDDSIAMFLYLPNEIEKIIDIWVMKEEGCWTKHLTIGPLLDVSCPLGFWKNGEIFIETNTSGELVLYDPVTQERKALGPHGKDSLKVCMYKESLVSIKGGNDSRERDNSLDVSLR